MLSPNKESPLATFNRWLSQGPTRASASASASAQRAPSYDASNIEHERAVIASAACGKSRTRVARGGSVGPGGRGGLASGAGLAASWPAVDLSQSAALAPFVRRAAGSATGKLIWPKASSLVAEERFDAQVELRALPPLGEKNVSGVSFVFSGPYVVPYFTEDQRAGLFPVGRRTGRRTRRHGRRAVRTLHGQRRPPRRVVVSGHDARRRRRLADLLHGGLHGRAGSEARAARQRQHGIQRAAGTRSTRSTKPPPRSAVARWPRSLAASWA